jgi:hypothetical protein
VAQPQDGNLFFEREDNDDALEMLIHSYFLNLPVPPVPKSLESNNGKVFGDTGSFLWPVPRLCRMCQLQPQHRTKTLN